MPARRMNIIALVEAQDHVCCRYRVRPFAPYLAERGMDLSIIALGDRPLTRARQMRAVRHAEVVILQRMRLPLWQLLLLRRSARRLLYDVDDAKFHRESYHPKGVHSFRRRRQYRAMVRATDAVIVGNQYLRQVTSRYAGPDRVHVFPTCVQPARYPLATHCRAGAEVRLAWIGSRATYAFLQCAEPHLAMAAQRLPGLELRVISDHVESMPGVSAVLSPWSTATEAADLADADIGVTWLPDDAWCRGKCGLKVLQYMAAGLPVVANPVGVHPEMIVHGRTGLLATTAEQWADAVQRLANDPELRRRMGAAGRKRVEEQYSVDAWGPRWAGMIEAVARGVVEPAEAY